MRVRISGDGIGRTSGTERATARSSPAADAAAACLALEVTLHAHGVLLTHSRLYHPQTCGRVERFHQTEK